MISQAAPEVLTVQEAANLLRISERHTYELIHSGQLKHARFGRSIRIARSTIESMLEGQA